MKGSFTIPRGRGFFLIFILAAASFIQIFNLIDDYGLLWTKRIFRLRDQPAKERSANYFLGASGAEYMAFLEAATPEEATIVIPPNAVAFSEQNVLQFYLTPRAIVSCGCKATNAQNELSQSCTRCLNSPGYYVPAIGDFPSSEILNETKTYLPVEPEQNYYQGIFAPRESFPYLYSSLESTEFNPISLLVIDVFILGAIFLLGAVLTILVLQRLHWLELFIFGLPLGGGILTWVMFLASWSGISLSATTISILYGLLLGAALLLLRHFEQSIKIAPAPKFRDLREQVSRSKLLPILTLIGVISLVVFASFLSVGRAYSVYDPIANWSVKGYAIADQGSILAGRDWGGHGLAYPLNLHLLISTFRLADGDSLPGSKLLFPLFTASLLLGCYRFWRRQSVPSAVALLGMFSLFSVPIIFQHATQGFANLPFTSYLVLGIFASLEGIFDNQKRSLFMGGLMFGMASWTRVEGLGYSLLIVLALLGARFISGKGKIRTYTWLIPLLMIPGVWLLFGAGFIGGDSVWEAGPSFIKAIAENGLNLQPLSLLFAHLTQLVLNTRLWGTLIPISVLLIFLQRKTLRSPRNPKLLSLFYVTLVAFIVPIGLFYVASYSRPNFERVMQINIDRAFFPAVFLLTSLAISTFGTNILSGEPKHPLGVDA